MTCSNTSARLGSTPNAMVSSVISAVNLYMSDVGIKDARISVIMTYATSVILMRKIKRGMSNITR